MGKKKDSGVPLVLTVARKIGKEESTHLVFIRTNVNVIIGIIYLIAIHLLAIYGFIMLIKLL